MTRTTFEDCVEDDTVLIDILEHAAQGGTYEACVETSIDLLAYALSSVALDTEQRLETLRLVLSCVEQRVRGIPTH